MKVQWLTSRILQPLSTPAFRDSCSRFTLVFATSDSILLIEKRLRVRFCAAFVETRMWFTVLDINPAYGRQFFCCSTNKNSLKSHELWKLAKLTEIFFLWTVGIKFPFTCCGSSCASKHSKINDYAISSPRAGWQGTWVIGIKVFDIAWSEASDSATLKRKMENPLSNTPYCMRLSMTLSPHVELPGKAIESHWIFQALFWIDLLVKQPICIEFDSQFYFASIHCFLVGFLINGTMDKQICTKNAQD